MEGEMNKESEVFKTQIGKFKEKKVKCEEDVTKLDQLIMSNKLNQIDFNEWNEESEVYKKQKGKLLNERFNMGEYADKEQREKIKTDEERDEAARNQRIIDFYNKVLPGKPFELVLKMKKQFQKENDIEDEDVDDMFISTQMLSMFGVKFSSEQFGRFLGIFTPEQLQIIREQVNDKNWF